MYNLDILEINNFEVNKIDSKQMCNTDNTVSASDWIKTDGKIGDKKDYVVFSSPLNFKQKTSKYLSDSLGFFIGAGNSVLSNGTHYSLSSSPISNNLSSIPVTINNFDKIVSLYSARKIIRGNWVNWYDEYLKPNVKHEFFNEYVRDSIIYSLFDSKSNQSSLRNILVNNLNWNIKNQFFWMSKDEMINLANQNNYGELYNDARTDSDRHVYNLLFGEQRIYDQLSDEAKDVLDSASNLVRLSFGMRRNFADDTNHLNSWDAGYAQLKLLWKEYYPEQFKEFRAKYKVLEDKMRPMVYELGFLVK
jgi:hypothetical protein